MRSPEPLNSQISFVLEADRLKTVARQNVITGESRRENSAEHSWHLALMAVVLADHAPPGTDLGKVGAMVVLHDLVEIDAGDLFLYSDPAAQARQEEAERAAADRLFAILPPAQAAELRGLWDEFEERRTPEARFARALDRLEEAGFVSRERDRHDRRRVVVTITLDRAMRDVASVFLPLLRDWRAMAARYSDDELRLIVDFYGRMEQVFRTHIVRLRDA